MARFFVVIFVTVCDFNLAFNFDIGTGVEDLTTKLQEVFFSVDICYHISMHIFIFKSNLPNSFQ